MLQQISISERFLHALSCDTEDWGNDALPAQ